MEESKLERAGTFPNLVALIQSLVFIIWGKERWLGGNSDTRAWGAHFKDRGLLGSEVRENQRLCFPVLSFTLGSISSAQNALFLVLPWLAPYYHLFLMTKVTSFHLIQTLTTYLCILITCPALAFIWHFCLFSCLLLDCELCLIGSLSLYYGFQWLAHSRYSIKVLNGE